MLAAGWCEASDVVPKAASAATSEQSVKEQLLALDARLDEAVMNADVTTLESIYADDVQYVHAGAAVIDTTRQAAIEGRAPAGLYLSRKKSEVDTRIFGDTALLSYYVELEHDTKKYPMLPPKIRYHHLRTYVRRGEEWRLVSQHSTWAVNERSQANDVTRYMAEKGYMTQQSSSQR
jgi:ketosteroid isomerase-like protein